MKGIVTMESQGIYYLGLTLLGLSVLIAAFGVPTFLIIRNNLKRQLEADYESKANTGATVAKVEAHCPETSQTGDVSGPKLIASLYEITRRLGSGGSGIVYLGRHLRLEKSVVLKADKRSLSEGSVTSLKREADTLKNLSHEYIPQIFDYVYENGIVYTVMDYIDGESLDALLERNGRFASWQIVRWAQQILEALAYLHASEPNGILHGDIKPANLMLTPQGNIRLIDFNVALALGEKGAVSVGRSLGYASPEHYGTECSPNTPPNKIKQGIAAKAGSMPYLETDVSPDETTPIATDGNVVLDARSDIYGLGATLYHLLTGRRPAQNADEVVPLTAEDCPPGLAAVINKAMSPDRKLRYQTAGEMLAAIKNIHITDPRARRARRLRTVATLVPATLLLIGAFALITGFMRVETENKSKAFVEASQNAFQRGDRPGAIKLALDAMPSGSDLFTPPVSADAQKALADALGIYDMSEGFKLFQKITLPSEPLMVDISPDGKTAALVCDYTAAVVDVDTGQVAYTLPMIRSALGEARFINGTTLVYSGQEGLCAHDVGSNEQLWRTDSPVAAIAVSADGNTIAAADCDGSFATLYDTEGKTLARIDFTGGKLRKASEHIQHNPRGDLFALSADGRFLAVSFTDGTLWVFNVYSSSQHRIKSNYNVSNNVRYEGGFSGNLLAFSATHANGSYFSVFNAENTQFDNLEGFFQMSPQFIVFANETGIFVSSDNHLWEYDPTSDTVEEIPLANPYVWSDSNIRGFAVWDEYILVVTDNACTFFDRGGSIITRFDRKTPTGFALISGDYALIGERDSAEMTVLRLERYLEAQVFASDNIEYSYREARVNEDGSRVMLYSAGGFRLYNNDGNLIREQTIPDPRWVYDQQFSKTSGNLSVIYNDSLLIYSGNDGGIIFEESGLRSIFYAPYGISVLDSAGRLRLIEPDSGAEILSENVGGDVTFAAYCGAVVDSAFLNGRKLIGAAKTADGFLFAVSDGENCVIYDGARRKRFDLPGGNQAKALFAEKAVVISQPQGSPGVFSLRNGSKIGVLEEDAYLTNIFEMGEYYVAQYLSDDGGCYGVLMDGAFRPIAALPRLCDTWNGRLVFDNRQGALLRSRIYSPEELVVLGATYISS